MIIDILFIIALVVGIYVGARKGLVQSLFSFITFFAGLILALKYSHPLALYMNEAWGFTFRFLPFFTFILIIIGVGITMALVSRIVAMVIKMSMLGWANRLAGAFLWVLIFLFFFSVSLWFVNQVNLVSPSLKAESQIYFYIEPLAEVSFDFISEIIPFLKDLFEPIESLFDKLSEPQQQQQQPLSI